jgi:hypothetical protein
MSKCSALHSEQPANDRQFRVQYRRDTILYFSEYDDDELIGPFDMMPSACYLMRQSEIIHKVSMTDSMFSAGIQGGFAGGPTLFLRQRFNWR